MQKQVIQFGTTHEVTVMSASAMMITVHAPLINEAFILMGHGMKELPKEGDKGAIKFEPGGPAGGYWKYYTEETYKQ